MIKFKCDSCQRSIGVDDKYAGKQIRCPGCSNATRIPGPDAAEPFVAEAVPATPAQATLTQASPSASAAPSCPNCPNCQTQLFNPADPICGVCGQVLQQTAPRRPIPMASGNRRPVAKTPIAAAASGGYSKTTSSRYGPEAYPRNKKETSVSRMAGAWLAACAATVVAAVIWGLIAPFIGLPGAVMAWGVAGIFGVIAGLIARTSSITFCLAACGGALLCLLVGKLISAGVVMASIGLIDTAASFGNMFIPETGVTMGALEDLVSEGTLTQEQQALAEKRTRAFFQNQGSADLFGINGETDSNVYLELNNKIRERVGSMSAAEKTVILERSRDRYPGWIEEPGMRIAIINHLVVKGLIEDQDLLRHADATMLTAMGEYPEDYYSRLPANKQEKLDPELGALVSETFRSMDAQQLEEAIRNCMKDNPQWTPRRHEFLAALDRMQNEETIPEHLVETATNTILAEMDNDYSVYPGYDEQMSEAEYELEFEKQNKLDKELRILVNKERNKLGQDDLDALVKQAKAGHPNWKTETEMTDIFDLFDDGLNEAKASFGSDGTFGSSLASRFKFMDTIWFALGLASCFAIVFTLGKAAE